MIIVSAASEVAPFAKTGGLADVTGSLPAALQKNGHQVLTFLPRYRSVDIKKHKLSIVIDQLEVPLGRERFKARIYRQVSAPGLEFYFVDQPDFFQRDELYGTSISDYPDNDRRFTFFQRALMETLVALDIRPDVIHCHDWQTGLIPAYLKTIYAKTPIFSKTKSVFTIHNLAYQGNFPPDSLPITGISWEEFRMEKLEFYGKVSFLKGGLVYADALTTVSERYGREIQTEEFGCGMDKVLTHRKGRIFGIVNGIDNEEWNPETDSDLASPFSAADPSNKKASKAALQKQEDMDLLPEAPLLGVVSRLIDQKGIDILVASLDAIAQMGCQFVLLGTGDEKYHHVLREYGRRHRRRFGIHIVFDPKMAKQIYAGCDMLLVPSYYEPCGLAHLIAMRYGTIPVVRATGGLADTVAEYNPATGKGNGFSFEAYKSEALVSAIQRAAAVYRDKQAWQALVQNAMSCDFSWDASARKYLDVYERLLKESSGTRGKGSKS
ncbi:MAG: starch synthase [Omnitrophica bacterium GWA2_52_12]|nr:MAG: starch synthase [Omnitrophica bacterium GWA2_52_12]